MIHLGFNAHGDYNALIEQVPKLKLILAHAGFPRYADIWKEIKENKNVYMDISAVAYVDGKTTRQLVDYLGAERCLYGTDGPYTKIDEDGKFDRSLRVKPSTHGCKTRHSRFQESHLRKTLLFFDKNGL